MPSSPNYVRDYKQEKKTSDARGEKKKRNARDRARYELEKLGMVHKHDGKDVDHIKPLSEGGAETKRENLRVVSEHKNRSFPRKSDGSMK
jgi:5-methylcytosine-specific restriction endonuclease McrA